MNPALNPLQQSRRLSVFSLFTSASTLICCALPATLVAIGSVATLTSLVSQFPQLVWISAHKPLVFGLAALMLLLAGGLQWRARHLPCPADAQLAAACQRARQQSLWMYLLSVTLFLIGSFFAFVAPWML